MNETNQDKLINEVFSDLIKSEHEHYNELSVDITNVSITMVAQCPVVELRIIDGYTGDVIEERNIEPDYAIRGEFEFVEWIKSTAFALKVHDACGVLLMRS